jgi:hypothetical protein
VIRDLPPASWHCELWDEVIEMHRDKTSDIRKQKLRDEIMIEEAKTARRKLREITEDEERKALMSKGSTRSRSLLSSTIASSTALNSSLWRNNDRLMIGNAPLLDASDTMNTVVVRKERLSAVDIIRKKVAVEIGRNIIVNNVSGIAMKPSDLNNGDPQPSSMLGGTASGRRYSKLESAVTFDPQRSRRISTTDASTVSSFSNDDDTNVA